MLNSGRPQGGSGEWEQPFWQQRGWILSAGFLVVLLVLAVLFAVTGDGGEGPAGSSGDPNPEPTSISTSKSSDGKGLRTPGPPAAAPTTVTRPSPPGRRATSTGRPTAPVWSRSRRRRAR